MRRLCVLLMVMTTCLLCPYAGAQCTPSPFDLNGDFAFSVSELLAPIQYYHLGYHCDVNGEGGYAAGLSDQNDCPPLSFDLDGDFTINLSELIQAIQFYNSGGYHCQVGDDDGYGPGLSEDGDISILSFETSNDFPWGVGDDLSYILRIQSNTNLPAHDLSYYRFQYSDGQDITITGNGYGTYQGVTTVSHRAFFLTPGIKTITVTVDPDNLVEETDETNNSVTLTIEVTDATINQN